MNEECLRKYKNPLRKCEPCDGSIQYATALGCVNYFTQKMHDEISQRFTDQMLDRIRRYNDSGVFA